jgi:DNA-binding LacI/PurR family transcriptional regulator
MDDDKSNQSIKQKNAQQRNTESPAVGLMLHANPWIRDEAQKRGWRLVSIFYGGLPDVSHVSLDGILCASHALTDEVGRYLRNYGKPAVRLGRFPAPALHAIPSVLLDIAAEGKLAATHFSEHRFKHVGFFGMDPWGVGKALFDGFSEGARESGMTCHLFQMKQVRGLSAA